MANVVIGTTGLSIDTSTGQISGIPTTPGNIRINVTATNSYGNVTKEIVIVVS
jgi:hypothetical protein